MIVKILKLVGYGVLFFLISVIIVNIFRPLFYQKLDGKYQENVAARAFESEETSTERVLCIDDNTDALTWRFRMIASAEASIVLSTFDLRADNSGTDIMAALYDAAERGVKVQLLIDGIYEIPQLKWNETFKALVAHQNVEARIYNPITLKTFYDLNYRMHDKYLIIDDEMYLLGGRNTNDIFLGKDTDTINIDREILVYETVPGEGESLKDLRDYFRNVWDAPYVQEVKAAISKDKLSAYDQMFRERYQTLQEAYGNFAEYSGWLEDTFEVNKISLISNESHNRNKEPRVLHVIKQLAMSGKEVWIQTPYVICNREMYGVLSQIAQEADLNIMINAVEKGSNPWGCTDYLNNKVKILKTGADVYELMNEQAVHTKTILVDDHISIIGSYNLDMRSTYLDTELMLVIDSERLNSHIREMINGYKEKSIEVLSDGSEKIGALYCERQLSYGKKLFYSVLRLIIIPFRHVL